MLSFGRSRPDFLMNFFPSVSYVTHPYRFIELPSMYFGGAADRPAARLLE
jgi:hypothetical protein